MVWTPPDRQVDLTLQRIISRAREEALIGFDEQRQRIERETVRTGFGGTPFHRCTEAASQAIRRFGGRIVPELLEVHRDLAGGGTPSPDEIQWIRDIVSKHVDALVDGLGRQIDGLRTTGGIKGARSRIEPAGREAKRDMEIELRKIAIRSRLVHDSSAPTPTADASIEIRRIYLPRQ